MARSTFLQTVVTGLMLAACSRDIDYQPEFPDVGPYLHQPACVECLHASCATEFDACMGDANCNTTYECRGDCTDPICHDKCNNAFPSALERGQAFMDEEDLEPLVTAFTGCAWNRCAVVCALGRDFHCVGRYDVDEPAAFETLELVAAANEFPDAKLIPGLTAAACPRSDLLCMSPNDSQDASAGPVTLTLRTDLVSTGFRHVVRYEPGADDVNDLDAGLPVTSHWWTLPFAVGSLSTAYLARRNFLAALSTSLGQVFDSQRPVVNMAVYDCASETAVRLRVETEADCAPFDQCAAFWKDGLPSFDLSETTAPVAASITAVPPADILFNLRFVDPETGRVVSSVASNPQQATAQNWQAYPLTGEQLKALPK